MIAKISWRIVFILISAGAIAFMVYQYLDSLQETTTVIVANEDIPMQTTIEADMLRTVTVEAQSAELLLPERVDNEELLIGGITKVNIQEGEPIHFNMETLVYPEDRLDFTTDDGRVDITRFIPTDRRLFTVGLEPDAAVDNRLEKGDFVDVIYTSTSQVEEEVYSRMILQYIEVFEVEEYSNDSGFGKEGLIQHITLLVTPQQSVVLANAKQEGNLDLVLNPSSGGQVEVEPIFQSSFEN